MSAHKPNDKSDFWMTVIVLLCCLTFGLWFQSWLHMMGAGQEFPQQLIRIFGAAK